MSTYLNLPHPLARFFSYFPLHSYPPIPSPSRIVASQPTLWISPPKHSGVDAVASDGVRDLLSDDVECLKWQAYLALRGLKDIIIRWDIAPEGGIDGRLPNLHAPMPGDASGEGELFAAHLIPGWVDSQLSEAIEPFEGYVNEHALDESHAWVSLLEGDVHAALVLSQPPPSRWWSLIESDTDSSKSLQSILSPPPAPLTGISSLIPPYGIHTSRNIIELQYRQAVAALSERLGTDKWFLGSQNPTALDALAFAYIHKLLAADDRLRIEITRRVNLVAWERRVKSQVVSAFKKHPVPHP